MKLTLQQKVERMVRYWQKVLRLKDWEIETEIMSDPTTFKQFASMTHSRNFQLAYLRVLDPDTIPEDWAGCKDLEVTVVHELVHTRFVYCIPHKSNNFQEEMAVETVAKALVALRRGVAPEDL